MYSLKFVTYTLQIFRTEKFVVYELSLVQNFVNKLPEANQALQEENQPSPGASSINFSSLRIPLYRESRTAI